MVNKKTYEKMTKKQAGQVKELRKIIKRTKIPAKKLDQNLLLATFNIKHFGGKRRHGFAINALAEICSNFDVVAIQELKSKLGDLKRLLAVLGPYWKVLFNDPAGEPRRPGNDERFAYLYDSRSVRFTGMAAELIISDDFLGPKGAPCGTYSVPWRTPYMASFRAGSFDFTLLTVHIQWNADGGITARAKEIEMITRWVGKRKNDAKLYDPDIFVLGDFNIPSLGSQTFKALQKHGLTIPQRLRSIKTNLKKDAHYDQIAYYAENTDCEVRDAGVIDFYNAFFKKTMSNSVRGKMELQISDHYPLWMEVGINETELDQFIRQ